MANYLTYADIRAAVAEQIKDPQQQWDTLIGYVVNQVYLTEVIPCDELDPLYWLVKPQRRRFKAPASITGITAANPPVITTDGAHALDVNDIIAVFGVQGMTEINLDAEGDADDFYQDILYTVGAVPAANQIQLADIDGDNVDASSWTAYTSGGSVFHHGWSWPVSLDRVLHVGIHDGLPLQKISWNDFMESPDRWIDESQSTPEAFIHEAMRSNTGDEYDLIMTFPGASESEVAYINASYNVPRLSADTDVPLLPYRFHDVIVTGSIVRLMENNVQVENAVVWPGLYQVQIDAIKEHNRRWWADHREGVVEKPYGLLG